MERGGGRPGANEDRAHEVLRRLRRQAEHETWMTMSAALSLCTLLLVAVLVLPVFGPRVAAVTAASVVLGIFTLCYFVCATRVAMRGAVKRRWPGAVLIRGAGVVLPHDPLPEDPPGDRFLAALAILVAGAFALMLVWLVGR